MIQTYRRFVSLDRTQRGLVIEAAVLTLIGWAGLRVFRFQTLRRLLDRVVVVTSSQQAAAGEDVVPCVRRAVVAVAARWTGRIAHVHLKDVRLDLARRVRAGQTTYTAAVAEGMYVPLGAGDAGIAEIVRLLEDGGYAGWYVLEQDTVLTAAPGEDGGADPLDDVRACVAFLLSLDGAAARTPGPEGR